jgi:hypothetical protein
MGKTDRELEKEADELLKQGNELIMGKQSDLAIPILLKSKCLNLLLGYKGQADKVVDKLEMAKKHVDRYNKSKRFSLNQDDKNKLEEEAKLLFEYSKALETRKRIDDALLLYNEAYTIFDFLNLEYESKQVFWLSRRLEEEQKIAAGDKKDNDVWTNFAEQAITLGKKAVGKKDYTNAKDWYKTAIDILKDLKMFDAVGRLYKERDNIEQLKVEQLKSERQKIQEQVLKEEQFQKRADEILSEKKKVEEEKLAQLKAIPPEVQEKLQKAQMLMDKAEKEVQMNKFQRAIGRYQIIIDLYQTIPKDTIDLSQKVTEIESKISDLKSKM